MNGTIHPHFVQAISRNLDYWQRQLINDHDKESHDLLPFHNEVVQAAQFSAAIPSTRKLTCELFHHYFNLIERNGLANQWKPIIETLLQDITTLPSNSYERQHLYFRQATLLRITHQISQAILILELLLKENLDPHLKGRVFLDLSLCHHTLGKNRDALSLAKQANDIFVAVLDQKWRASTLNNLGIFATELGEFEDAESFLHEAYQLEIVDNDATRIVRVLNNLGRLFEKQALHKRSLSAYFEAKEYLDGISSNGDQLINELNLAHAFIQLEQYKNALETLLSAEKRQNDFDDIFLSGITFLNLGEVNFRLKNYIEAQQYTEQAIGLFDQLNRIWFWARALINLGDIHRSLEKLELAQEKYTCALDRLNSLDEEPSVIEMREEARNNLACIGR